MSIARALRDRSAAVPICDCHAHVLSPGRFAYAPDRLYTPGEAPAERLRALHARLGIGRTVLVHASVHGDDAASLLDAISAYPGEARGVGPYRPDIDGATRTAWRRAGIRALRLNLANEAARDGSSTSRRVAAATRAAAAGGWHLEINAPWSRIAELSRDLADSPVPIVFDHFAGLGAANPFRNAALGVERLLGRGFRIKLSAPDRWARSPVSRRRIGKAIRRWSRIAPELLVWGSDWPHTSRLPPDDRGIQPFQRVDDAAGLAWLRKWADPGALPMILARNPALLYDFPRTSGVRYWD
jgi:predicted TIM-barrel fold metal-dependent hydrolase